MELPDPERELLASLRGDLPALRARVRALRAARWTLESIGRSLGAPRSTVRSWQLHPSPGPDLTDPVPLPPSSRPLPSTAPTRALAPDVPAPDAALIARLSPLARRVRGGTPPSSPAREAAAQLNALVRHHHARGVPTQRLATLAGVSYRAMRVRLDAT